MITQREFNLALACVLHSASTDPANGELQVILFEFISSSQLNLVSTDRHRITIIELEISHGQPVGSSFILFAPYASKLIKEFPAKVAGRISLSCWGDSIIFTDGERVEVFEKLSGDPQFPDYRRALTRPDSPPASARMSHKYLLDALIAMKPLTHQSIDISLHDLGPSYVTPRLDPDLESIRSVRVGITAMRP